MRPAHLIWSRLAHGVVATVVLAALVADLTIGMVERGHSSAPLGTHLIREYSFFTQQSNIVVLAAALTLVINPRRDGAIWRILRVDAVLGIVITGVVYPVFLAGSSHAIGAQFWINAGLHYVSPWATVVAWLVFGPRPRIDRRTILAALIWPLLWVGYTFLHGAMSGWYPYYFLDVGDIGYRGALNMVALLLVFGVVILLIMRLADRVLPVVGGRDAGKAPSWKPIG